MARNNEHAFEVRQCPTIVTQKLRFAEKYVIVDSGCWEWTASKTPPGYAKFSVGRKQIYAHRFSFSVFVGEIPDGLEVMHTCDNRSCVNPQHLRVGTHQENMQEAKQRKRMSSGVNHHNYGTFGKLKNSVPVVINGAAYVSKGHARSVLGLTAYALEKLLRSKESKTLTTNEREEDVISK